MNASSLSESTTAFRDAAATQITKAAIRRWSPSMTLERSTWHAIDATARPRLLGGGGAGVACQNRGAIVFPRFDVDAMGNAQSSYLLSKPPYELFPHDKIPAFSRCSSLGPFGNLNAKGDCIEVDSEDAVGSRVFIDHLYSSESAGFYQPGEAAIKYDYLDNTIVEVRNLVGDPLSATGGPKAAQGYATPGILRVFSTDGANMEVENQGSLLMTDLYSEPGNFHTLTGGAFSLLGSEYKGATNTSGLGTNVIGGKNATVAFLGDALGDEAFFVGGDGANSNILLNQEFSDSLSTYSNTSLHAQAALLDCVSWNSANGSSDLPNQGPSTAAFITACCAQARGNLPYALPFALPNVKSSLTDVRIYRSSIALGAEGVHVFNPNALYAGANTTYDFQDITVGGSAFNGVHDGINFGSGIWLGYANPNLVIFASGSVTSGSFTLPAGMILKSLSVSDSQVPTGTYSISDGVNAPIGGNTSASDTQIVTGWTSGGQAITVNFSTGWYGCVYEIAYGFPATTAYTCSDITSQNQAVNGVHGGIDFGSGKWLGWPSPKCLFFPNASATSETFTLPAGTYLHAIRMNQVSGSGTYKISDGVHSALTGPLTNSMTTLNTGWSIGGRTITVYFSGGWNGAVYEIDYGP